MKLIDLQPVLQLMATQSPPTDLRAITYFTTYPSILALGTATVPIQLIGLHQLSVIAYGWMPRIVRLDPQHTANALAAVQQAQAASTSSGARVVISALADCLRSVVGASKVLHFVNPAVFPIWDSNIERFRQRRDLSTSYMSQIPNYAAYMDDVHAILRDRAFPKFYSAFNARLGAWLTAMGVAPYTVSEVRAIELAAFELSR